jgi:hypothetical protein
MTAFDPDEMHGVSGDLKHCGQDFTYKGARFSWEGQPQEGFSISTYDLECPACLTQVSVTVKELS